MKTKFTKVAVEERLPLKEGNYIVEFPEGMFMSVCYTEDYSFHEEFTDCSEIVNWLEEIPDREEEMIEMLERIQDLDVLPIEIEDELSTLLQSLKQEK